MTRAIRSDSNRYRKAKKALNEKLARENRSASNTGLVIAIEAFGAELVAFARTCRPSGDVRAAG